ncbi:hypothetical protein MBAV_005051 [Candidatus Magnetobacterium bavaricum]|uniref:Uncharacterized protein n=1 Tax=Candidatus Magnetobacterium bavaricum TaxID=29290 RepID=A0A0F3GQ01_9BACT|nr:hypothetical protein MBAV_005051 [Candidatus Magnetobacterium bavaricum]
MLLLKVENESGQGAGKEELYKQYKEAFKSCSWIFIPDDRTFLKGRQKQLGLTDDEVLRIEQEVKNE